MQVAPTNAMWVAPAIAMRVAPAIAMLVVLLLLLAACGASVMPGAPTFRSPLSPLPAPTATPRPLALTIVHSNDSWGYLDPCG